MFKIQNGPGLLGVSCVMFDLTVARCFFFLPAAKRFGGYSHFMTRKITESIFASCYMIILMRKIMTCQLALLLLF